MRLFQHWLQFHYNTVFHPLNFLKQIHRIPIFGDLRVKWIEVISQYQEWDVFNDKFMVCDSHFSEDCFIEENRKKTLKRDSVPSFLVHEIEFVSLSDNTNIDDQVLNDTSNNSRDEGRCLSEIDNM